MFNVQEELKKLPPKPGVYIMHDERDAIIYVGRAYISCMMSGMRLFMWERR